MKKLLLLSLAVINLPAAQMAPKRPSMASLEGLPTELKNIVLQNIGTGPNGVLNIPALAQGITSLAAASKKWHAVVNNPQNMLAVLKSLPRAGAVVLANGLRNMPGMKNIEVEAWLKSLNFEGGRDLFIAVAGRGLGLTSVPLDIARIKTLLANPNMDVNVRDHDKKSILMHASDDGYTEVVKLLLDAGADVNVQDRFGDTVLMLAADNGHAEIIKALLTAGANVNIQNDNGYTALMLAHRAARAFGQAYNKETIKLLEEAEKAQKEKAARK